MFNKPSTHTELTLSRKRQFMEANIPVNILVNGFLACQLKSGEMKTIPIYTHDIIQLQAGLMNNKTAAIEINETEREENIYRISHVISNSIYIVGVALAILSTILVFSTGQIVYMVLAAPPAFLLLFFKFIKKDRYLRVSILKKPEMMYRPSEN